MANSFHNEFYRSPKTLSYFVIGLFGILILCLVGFLISSLIMIAAPDAAMDLGEDGTLNIGLALVGLVSGFYNLVRLVTVVLFFVWLYRAFSNLSALKATNLEFSPGWAVGWWFIPFANLIKPYQAMSELYDASDPAIETSYLSASSGTPANIIFWWLSFLASNIVWSISNKLIDNSGNYSQYFPVFIIVSSCLSIVAASLILLLVRDITQREELLFSKIAAEQNYQPPMPPTFNQNF